jgi:hypothetical protein
MVRLKNSNILYYIPKNNLKFCFYSFYILWLTAIVITISSISHSFNVFAHKQPAVQGFVVARSKGTHFVITANRTEDGAAVYLRADRSWSERLEDAHPIPRDAPEARDELLAYARGQERWVCDPYAFGVDVGPRGPLSLSRRESIRGVGPTTPQRRPDAPAPRKSA